MSGDDQRFQRATWNPPPDPNDDFDQTSIWTPGSDAIPPDPPLLWLIVAAPRPQRGTVLAVQPNDVFGRGAAADVKWDDTRLSRRHARFTLELDPDTPGDTRPAYFIWPLEARHGLAVNQAAIRGATRLKENDMIQMGDTLFVVKILP